MHVLHCDWLASRDANGAPQKCRYVLVETKRDGFALTLALLTFAGRGLILACRSLIARAALMLRSLV